MSQYMEVTIYGQNKSFLELLSSLQWPLFETSRIIILEVRRFYISIY